jgi:hypothetical protein
MYCLNSTCLINSQLVATCQADVTLYTCDYHSIQHYVIMFVSDLRQVGGFLRFPPSNKTVSHEITEIFLKVALNTITLTTVLV